MTNGEQFYKSVTDPEAMKKSPYLKLKRFEARIKAAWIILAYFVVFGMIYAFVRLDSINWFSKIIQVIA